MERTSPVHYIAPSAISITPNANNNANDVAVFIERNTKIKVYSPKAGLDTVGGEYQEWTLTGRNRRLADPTDDHGETFIAPYTIYARLNRQDKTDGYLVFAPKVPDGGEWKDKHRYVTPEGTPMNSGMESSHDYYYIRLGEVTLPENGERTVNLDTGILGTEQFNTEWALNPDALPLRIELGCTVNNKDAGPTPYVYWGQTLVLTASLVEGWTGTDIGRFDHWEIVRNSGNTNADNDWNNDINVDGEDAFWKTGSIELQHGRGATLGVRDDFNSAVNTTFTIMAMENTGTEESPAYDVLKAVSIDIMAETWEKYELSLAAQMVTYNPIARTYSPNNGIKFNIRAYDQRGNVFLLTNEQVSDAGLVAQHAVIDTDSWTAITISGPDGNVAEGAVPSEAFSNSQQSINVRLRNSDDPEHNTGTELFRTTIAFLRDGEDSKEREWIFLRSATEITFGDASSAHPLPSLITVGQVNPPGAADGSTQYSDTLDDWVPQGWWDEQQGVTDTYQYEYGSYRDFVHESNGVAAHWGAFSTPKIWNHYGKDAVVYKLKPSPTQIAVGRTNDGGYVQPSASSPVLICGYTKSVGSTITEVENATSPIDHTTGNTGYLIVFRRRLRATKNYDARFYLYDTAGSNLLSTLNVTTYDLVEFRIIPYTLVQTDRVTGLSWVNSASTFIDEATVPVVADGVKGADGENATEINPNILLRTVFDKGIDFVKEKWDSNWNCVSVPTNTPDTEVEGRLSVRINAGTLEDGQFVDFKQDVYGKLKPATWYTLSFNHSATHAFNTYLWSGDNSVGVIDTSAGIYVDGVFQATVGQDGGVAWPAEWSMNRHSITFKTAASFQTQHFYILFRTYHQAHVVVEDDVQVEQHDRAQTALCMPKLELGRVATAYVANEDDLIGEKGDDAVNVVVSPASMIVEQDINNKNNIEYAANKNLGMFSIQVLKGIATACTITRIVATASNVYVHNDGSTGPEQAPSSCDWQPNNQIAEMYLKGIAKDNQNNYYTIGQIVLSVYYTDPDTGAGKTITSIIARVYVNLIGTWSETVEGDIKTELASKTLYKFDDDPNSPTYGQFIESINWGEFQRSSTENISTLTKKVNNGKNLLSGVLTGTGWKSTPAVNATMHDVTVSGDTIIRASGDTYIVSPEVSVVSGTVYTLSFYFTSATGGNRNVYIVGQHTIEDSISAAGRHSFTFTAELTESVRVYVGLAALYHPQLETGTTPTEFDARTTEVSSQIKQTADGIEDRVENAEGDIGQLKIAADAISLGVTNGWKNYVSNPVATDGTIQTGNVDSYSVVDDSLFGKVYRIARSNAGDWQLLFTKDSAYSELTGQYVTWFCVVRPVASGSVNFGSGYANDDSTTHGALVMTYDGSAFAVSSGLSSSVFEGIVFDFTKISSDGWYLCYASAKLPNEQTIINGDDIIGFNTLTGTWDVYYCGIVKGRGCPSIDMIKQGAGLKRAGIDIGNGIINLMAGKVKFVDPNGDAYAIPKVIIDPTDGTLHAVDGYFSGEVHATSGEFVNVKISGGMRSPFTYIGPGSTFNNDFSDNLAIYSTDEAKDENEKAVPTAYNIPWDSSQSGRRIIVANYKWGNGEQLHTGYVKISAPTGKYFFEDGIQKPSIYMSREVIELIGYGDSSNFYGWIVLTRTDLGTNRSYGHNIKVLAMGVVTVTGTTDADITAIGQTFDKSSLSLVRNGVGKYTITFGNTNWFENDADVFVMVTGCGSCVGANGNPVYANLNSKNKYGFTVWTGDDDTLNDGSFNFIVMNYSDWSSIVKNN